jgi:hypothetical protein
VKHLSPSGVFAESPLSYARAGGRDREDGCSSEEPEGKIEGEVRLAGCDLAPKVEQLREERPRELWQGIDVASPRDGFAGERNRDDKTARAMSREANRPRRGEAGDNEDGSVEGDGKQKSAKSIERCGIGAGQAPSSNLSRSSSARAQASRAQAQARWLPPVPEEIARLRPPGRKHDSLGSFLDYAKSRGLRTTSSTYVGTYYEYLCLLALRRLGFSLIRTGGSKDKGIDLLGVWHLPSLPHPLRCIVQCKSHAAGSRPDTIRAIEGAFSGAPARWRNGNAVGVVCARDRATVGVVKAIKGSPRALVWITVDGGGETGSEGEGMRGGRTGGGKIRQVLWNQAAADLGAHGMGVQIIHRESDTTMGGEAVLTWKGQRWEPEGWVEETNDTAEENGERGR